MDTNEHKHVTFPACGDKNSEVLQQDGELDKEDEGAIESCGQINVLEHAVRTTSAGVSPCFMEDLRKAV